MQQHNLVRLSIAQTARGAGMSIQNLRKTYINKGKLTVRHDDKDMPYVEVVECLRVFPDFLLPRRDGKVADNPVAAGYEQLLQQREALAVENAHLRTRLQIEEQQRRKAEA